ncbi:uncharacterized protein LOC108908277 [Anoplophora glabripennis]|uniref:uncharacterized protein LOC108908277 n=1 Tax=Anoplophora glabripennis TaxID=217634 RepID=UPI000874A0E4|nr:uncharacterized protein LOC108908277 [Anoplophora glabripennis]
MSILNKSLSRISGNLLHIAKYSVNISNSTNPFVFKTNFTPEEQQKVLSILNSSNLEQLASFSVSQSRIKNLESWRTKKGPFRSLNEVLEVDGLGEKVLEKICENIINYNTDETTIKKNNGINKRLKQLVSPPIPPNVVNKIQSTVGIHLGPMGISWAKLSRVQNELNNWNSLDFSTLPKKMLPTETFGLAIRVLQKLPPGDIYILEATPSMSPQATAQVSAITTYNQQLELTSMLIALLNTSIRHNTSLQNTETLPIENIVYHLRTRIPARLFRTLVGNERVSALTKVTELVQNDGKLNHFSLPCTPVNVKEQLKNAFLSQTPASKELLGQALMLVVSFMDLCVYKNPISLVAIASGKNNNK